MIALYSVRHPSPVILESRGPGRSLVRDNLNLLERRMGRTSGTDAARQRQSDSDGGQWSARKRRSPINPTLAVGYPHNSAACHLILLVGLSAVLGRFGLFRSTRQADSTAHPVRVVSNEWRRRKKGTRHILSGHKWSHTHRESSFRSQSAAGLMALLAFRGGCGHCSSQPQGDAHWQRWFGASGLG